MVDGVKVHPTFLYESLWCLLVFVVLIVIGKRRKFLGQIFLSYCVLYSFERFFVEQLRTDSLLLLGQYKQAQILSLVVIIAAAAFYMYLKRKGGSDDVVFSFESPEIIDGSGSVEKNKEATETEGEHKNEEVLPSTANETTSKTDVEGEGENSPAIKTADETSAKAVAEGEEENSSANKTADETTSKADVEGEEGNNPATKTADEAALNADGNDEK
jgi:hypothetical protein